MLNKVAFIKDIGIVALGPVIASLVGLLAEPLISRLWEPSVYGIGTYFNSVLQLLTPIVFLRYNFAIVQAKNDVEGANLMALSIIIMVVLVGVVTVCSPVFTWLSGGSFVFAQYWKLLIVALMMGSISILLRFWASSKKKFYLISLSYVMLQVPAILLLIIFGILGRNDEQTMIRIRAISYLMFPIFLLWDFFKNDIHKWAKHLSISGIVQVAKAYRDYPLHEYPGFVASIVAFNLPVILITRYWGNEVTGLYAKAFLILYMFVTILGDSVNRVFHKEVADMYNRGNEISSFVKKISLSVIKISIVPFSMIVVAGPEIFSFVLGAKWHMSGVFAQAMAIWSFATLINMTLLPLYGVLNKQKQYTRFTLLALFVQTGLLTIMGYHNIDVVAALYMFSLTSFLMLTWQSIYVMGASGVPYAWTIKVLMVKVLQVLPMVLSVFIIRHYFNLPPSAYLMLCGLLSIPYLYYYVFRASVFSDMMKRGRSLLIR